MIVDQAAQIYHKSQCEQTNWASTCHMRSVKSLLWAAWNRSCVGGVQTLKMWCNRPWLRFRSRAASQCDTLQQDKLRFRISNSAQTLIISDIPVGHIQLIPQNSLCGEERILVAGYLQKRYGCRFKCKECYVLILPAQHARAWVRAALNKPLHPITTANQPKWGMGSGSHGAMGKTELIWFGSGPGHGNWLQNSCLKGWANP